MPGRGCSATLRRCARADRAKPRVFETPVDAVVVAVRADFYERCVDYPDLAARLQEGQMVLGPMTRDEVRTAVSGPAALVGVPLEPGLVDIIVRDLGDGNGAVYSSGALPLLGHALLATWEARAGDSLTVRAYESVGGVRGAVARTAEAVWEALTPAEQVAARQILMRLVAVGDDGPDTRRTLSPRRSSRMFEYQCRNQRDECLDRCAAGDP